MKPQPWADAHGAIYDPEHLNGLVPITVAFYLRRQAEAGSNGFTWGYLSAALAAVLLTLAFFF